MIATNTKIAPCLYLILALGLSACVGTPPERGEMAYYDLPGNAAAWPTSLRSLDVAPAPWLAGNAMYYRLAYADASRREHFSGSRWTAQPADLLEIRLKRSLMGGREEGAAAVSAATPAAPPASEAASNCRLRIDLDELTQVFEAPGRSHMQLDARATLYGAHQSILARRVLTLTQPAGADAHAGVAATGVLADQLARELQGWLLRTCR